MLAPHARGRIELSVDMEAIDGLEAFGYVWIVFGFHLNTVGARTRTKIAAPARGTTKRVGVLATRSPHRFNCVGITLAKLDGVELLERRHGAARPKRIPCLRISGHDLVDGTPVFDIKVRFCLFSRTLQTTCPVLSLTTPMNHYFVP
jgi:tRNA (adenine37-N6)-methyltransferase